MARYSEEHAGRFMQMATNLSHSNAQPFVKGRRIHHINFKNGVHADRNDNPVWPEQIGKLGNHDISHSCAACHVRNGRALVSDVGTAFDRWVFKVADANDEPDALIGSVLQPEQIGAGDLEGTVSLGAWSESTSLRSPNYIFSRGAPARFSARIAPQLVGMGLLDAVPESVILQWSDEEDSNSDGISGRAAEAVDPFTGDNRLGRFVYKGATSSVRHQVAVALNADIGAGLADNLGEGIAAGNEWRTTPLWGLGHAASVMLGDTKANDEVSRAGDVNDLNRIGYLHDGLARSIDEAIRWHGGEGEVSKLAYEALLAQIKQPSLTF